MAGWCACAPHGRRVSPRHPSQPCGSSPLLPQHPRAAEPHRCRLVKPSRTHLWLFLGAFWSCKQGWQCSARAQAASLGRATSGSVSAASTVCFVWRSATLLAAARLRRASAAGRAGSSPGAHAGHSLSWRSSRGSRGLPASCAPSGALATLASRLQSSSTARCAVAGPICQRGGASSQSRRPLSATRCLLIRLHAAGTGSFQLLPACRRNCLSGRCS